MKKILTSKKSNTELVTIQRNDAFTNSWIIAENIGYAHKTITKHISKYKERFEKMGGTFYSPGVKSNGGRPIKSIDLNEQQAIFLMTLLDNSEIVLDFKMVLSIEFVRVKRLLLERQSAEWQQTRQQSKQMRLQETDAIKQLIEYARTQGSFHADKLYLTYSKLVKQLTGHDNRETADAETLFMIMVLERTLFGIITNEMMLDTPYKEIYKKAKQELTQLKLYWSRPALHSPMQSLQATAVQ